MNEVLEVRTNLIKVGDRFRKDMGDLDSLAASIKDVGLLQPIGIDSNYRLIFGERRLRACEILGLERIAARFIDVAKLAAEHAENEVRKDFTAAERVAIAKAIEDELKATERRGRPKAVMEDESEDEIQDCMNCKHGRLLQDDSLLCDVRGETTHVLNLPDEETIVEWQCWKPENVENFPQLDGKKSRQIAAEKAGFGNETTYRQARKVTEEAIPELVDAMDKTISISAAAMATALPKEEQQAIMAEIEQGGKPSEVIKNHVLATKHTGDEESYTPQEYLASARAVMGAIDLDPASNPMAQENVGADRYFTVDDDGLTQEWAGKVWMNPPYTARVINRFIDKLVDHYEAGEVTQAIVLTNNNTDTSWFHQGANAAAAVCFTAGRINFLKRDGSRSSPTNGQAFLYFGDNLSAFKNEFGKHGMVMVKA